VNLELSSAGSEVIVFFTTIGLRYDGRRFFELMRAVVVFSFIKQVQYFLLEQWVARKVLACTPAVCWRN